MGSGTRAVSAKNLNRQFIGFEIMEDYYKNSLKRLEKINQFKQYINLKDTKQDFFNL
jgi:DNA modification methylase